MFRPYLLGLLIAFSSLLTAQDATLAGTVNVVHRSKSESRNADVVIWLTPTRLSEPVMPGPTARLVQKNKGFVPHLLAVPVGTEIEFPNQDPFFHDVFSIYHGRPFDLGLYQGGAVRKIRFSEPGVSYIFCNIHPEMSAVVIALSTPYFAITAREGSFQVSHVPPGQYKLEVWHEFASEAELASLSRDLKVTSGENAPVMITLHSSDAPKEHLNKYGEPYAPVKAKSY